MSHGCLLQNSFYSSANQLFNLPVLCLDPADRDSFANYFRNFRLTLFTVFKFSKREKPFKPLVLFKFCFHSFRIRSSLARCLHIPETRYCKEEFATKMVQLPEIIIPKLKFLRLVRSLTAEFNDDVQFAASALAALQVLYLNCLLAHYLLHRWIKSLGVVLGSCGNIRHRRNERRDNVLRKRRTWYSYSWGYGGIR